MGAKESGSEQDPWGEDLDCAGRRRRLWAELRDGMLVGKGLGRVYNGARVQLQAGLGGGAVGGRHSLDSVLQYP